MLQAKKEIYDIKQQRLYLAQDEYNHLNNVLSTLNTSRTSCKYCTTDSGVFLLIGQVRVFLFSTPRTYVVPTCSHCN